MPGDVRDVPKVGDLHVDVGGVRRPPRPGGPHVIHREGSALGVVQVSAVGVVAHDLRGAPAGLGVRERVVVAGARLGVAADPRACALAAGADGAAVASFSARRPSLDRVSAARVAAGLEAGLAFVVDAPEAVGGHAAGVGEVAAAAEPVASESGDPRAIGGPQLLAVALASFEGRVFVVERGLVVDADVGERFGRAVLGRAGASIQRSEIEAAGLGGGEHGALFFAELDAAVLLGAVQARHVGVAAGRELAGEAAGCARVLAAQHATSLVGSAFVLHDRRELGLVAAVEPAVVERGLRLGRSEKLGEILGLAVRLHRHVVAARHGAGPSLSLLTQTFLQERVAAPVGGLRGSNSVGGRRGVQPGGAIESGLRRHCQLRGHRTTHGSMLPRAVASTCRLTLF